MIVRHGTLWAIAVLVLLASVSFSESVKLRKPRKRTMAKSPYQQSRIGSVIIRVMHKYSDDDLKRGASAGCINGNCRNTHNKFNFEPVNEAMSEKDNFLSDEESLRYVVHPEKYEHFVLRKNTGHANRYKRDSTFSELPNSSNTDDRTVVNRDGDASEVSKNVNKRNFTKKIYRLPLYRTVLLNRFNKYPKNLLKPLSEVNRTRSLAVDYFSQRNDDDNGNTSKVQKYINKGHFIKVPLYRTVSLNELRYTKNSEPLNEANRTRRSLAIDCSSQRNDSDSGDASKVPKNVNKGNFTRVPLYRTVSLDGLNRYTKNSKRLSEASRMKRSLAVDYSSQRNDNDSGDASKVPKNVNKGNFTRVPLYRTVSLDGLNRYTKNSKRLSEASRTRRSLAVDYSSQRNDNDSGDASKVPKNVNKGNFTRVPLYRTVSLDGLNRYTKNLEPLSEASRTRRSLAVDYSSRRNDSDYYAQRKAVMDRYYARQREINARYAANRINTTPRLKYNNVSQHQPTSNVTLFNLGHVYPSKDSTARDNATFLHLSTKIDPIYSNESRYNKIPTELDSRRNFVPEIDPGFRSDTDSSQTRSSGNSERNALDYFVTPTPCTNLSSNGTFAPKTRPKLAQNSINETEQSNEDCAYNSAEKNNTEGNLRWGKCEGKIVYQHNLLLGLRGPSNLDALFEVIIQGPVCITCVEALRYNETRAIVALDSGGRGYEYAKLRLQGYENEGFSYIIKVWGINKIGEVCGD
ncbi:hypothetical protein ALC60_05878 [Trachymyrmex zeteki]|uniref:Uncharacterized protein n=1 Tax=Mycetomoellerius zeteki TaxID=64791 RepID=A0A151X4A7_9HYME|nr:PREDICTED: uncharacterized protein LOC108723002 [Trachymyrmex zeteki]KYQ55253.1 hypothetical protein ALC60_05878 [Trachymyrmex zeteki]